MNSKYSLSIWFVVAWFAVALSACASTDKSTTPPAPLPPQAPVTGEAAEPIEDRTGAPLPPQAPAPVAQEPGDECAALDADACQASEACMPVRGARVVASAGKASKGGHCVKAREVIGCIPAQMCGQAISYFCDAQGVAYEVSNTCGPSGWKQCQAPDNLAGSCP